MPPIVLKRWLAGLAMIFASVLGKDSDFIAVGSACSGSDIYKHCIDALQSYWKETYAVPMKPFRVVLCVEKEPAKQAFLKEQRETVFLVENTSSLRERKAFNL
eukprot:6101100-Lingulodinium_polyedra.AAC.1